MDDNSKNAKDPEDYKGVDGAAAGSSTNDDTSEGTLTDYLCKHMQLLVEEKMFAVIPLPSCPHLGHVQSVPPEGLDINMPCVTCKTTIENWVCLTCYTVGCGHHVSGHMQNHGETSGHPLTLSFSDLSVWCYQCEAYIDNKVLYLAKNAAHLSKFSTEMPWSYKKE